MTALVRGMSRQRKNRFFGALFLFDGVLAMFPPVYWAVNEVDATVLGLPFSVLYFLVTGLLITVSVMALYLVEELRGEVG